MKRKVNLGQTMERLWLVGVHRLLNTQSNNRDCIHLQLPITVLNSMGKMIELLDPILISYGGQICHMVWYKQPK